MSGSSFIAGIHRFLRKSKTLSILTVPNLKIHKNTKISLGKVLRGKSSPKKDGQRGRGFIWTRLWTQTYFRSSLVTFRWLAKQGDDRKYVSLPRRRAFFGLRQELTTFRGVLKKCYTGRLYPEAQSLTFLYTLFWQKNSPFRIPSIDKWYPFHIPSLELSIPFNNCKCIVFKI